ncbi:MAG: inosine 5-monophosphate dehydrogenase [Treponema sp.]|nr:MAG: inosine 5-monophosphate dehydrogenase [Treponema sp.]
MAFFYDEPSHTFNEYLLVPGYSSCRHTPENVDLKTPLTRFKAGEEAKISLNTPLVSAIMQSVSDDKMAIALAREGGVSFVFCSQSIESQAAMISRVKNYKAGFVESDSNVCESATLHDVLALRQKTGHTTVAVTDDGKAHGKLLGVITGRDYREGKTPLSAKVSDLMTPISQLSTACEGVTLTEANDRIWEHKLNSLPVLDKAGNLVAFVFRKDYENNQENPFALLDDEKRYVVGAGVNTRDYEKRIPALVEAGVDVLCLDSSEGFSEWQKKTIEFVKEKYGDSVPVGAGNVVDADGFNFLADAGADFIKVGIGGGSICITRETKGIGRGQATSVIEVAKARDDYYKKTGVYIPICSDGGIVFDYHITLALAMGADFCMLGRYFARFDESPTNRFLVNGSYMKEYWGEGSARARNWQRYDSGGAQKLSFEEGVDSYVPYAGKLHDSLNVTLKKIKSTMCNCGVLTLSELRNNAKLTRVSASSIAEGGAHDVILKDINNTERHDF